MLLDDGRTVYLAGLDYAAGAQQLADAHRRLSARVQGQLAFVLPLREGLDRWGRSPAAIFLVTGEGADSRVISLGAALLDAGDARFRPDPRAASCAAAYRAAEAQARRAGRGVWADPAFRPIDANSPSAGAFLLRRKGFTLVSGVVRSTGESRNGASYLNFGEKRIEDFSVVISRRNLSMFVKAGLTPRSLVGRRVLVRGLIETGFGPRMEIATPDEMEFIDPPDAH